jgi:hypothetical protein
MMDHDLMFVAQPHDFVWIRYTLPITLRYIQPTCIYILTYATAEATLLFPECTIVSLTRLPFTYEDVASIVSAPYAMTYLVQLARLYAADILPLQRPLVFVDADAAIVQPIRLESVGTRHGTNPYVFAHLHTLHPTLKKELPQCTDVPYYRVEPQRLQLLHHEVSEAHLNEPFWRIYLTSISPLSKGQGASDKELYVTWLARHERPQCYPLRIRRLENYADLTYHVADTKEVQVVTCSPETQGLLLCFRDSTWTWVQRWLGNTPLTTPFPPQVLSSYTPSTVVHYGCRELMSLEPWEGWSYVGVDVGVEAVNQAQSRFPSLTFSCLDVCVDPLPEGTLSVCTEFLTRLSYAHALTFLLRASKRYTNLIMVEFIPTGTSRVNKDHPSGEHRVIWWDLPPYNVWGFKEHGRVPLEGGTLFVHQLLTTSQT